MKLYFGQVLGNRYILEIVRRPSGCHEADLKVADSDNDCVYSINRDFSDKFGKWTDNGIRTAVLNEYREDQCR